LAISADSFTKLEEPILHLLWGVMEWFYGYNFPNTELIWIKPGI